MRPFSPQNATFTDGSPGVGSPGWYVNPRDVVSWMWSLERAVEIAHLLREESQEGERVQDSKQSSSSPDYPAGQNLAKPDYADIFDWTAAAGLDYGA